MTSYAWLIYYTLNLYHGGGLEHWRLLVNTFWFTWFSKRGTKRKNWRLSVKTFWKRVWHCRSHLNLKLNLRRTTKFIMLIIDCGSDIQNCRFFWLLFWTCKDSFLEPFWKRFLEPFWILFYSRFRGYFETTWSHSLKQKKVLFGNQQKSPYKSKKTSLKFVCNCRSQILGEGEAFHAATSEDESI